MFEIANIHIKQTDNSTNKTRIYFGYSTNHFGFDTEYLYKMKKQLKQLFPRIFESANIWQTDKTVWNNKQKCFIVDGDFGKEIFVNVYIGA